MEELNENVIIINNQKYDLDKLADDEIVKLLEYVIKKGNYLMEKIENMVQ